MNIKRLMYKLQTALNMNGHSVKINQVQLWSEPQNRMVTKYVVIDEGKTILESYKSIDIVQALARMVESG